MALALCLVCVCVCSPLSARADESSRAPVWRGEERYNSRSESIIAMILPQVHLRKPCYDFSFL